MALLPPTGCLAQLLQSQNLGSGYQQLDSAVSTPWTNTAALFTSVASTDLGREIQNWCLARPFVLLDGVPQKFLHCSYLKQLEFLENPQCMLLARLSIKYILVFFQSVYIYQKKTLVETMYKASKNSSIKKNDVLIKVWRKQPAKLRAIDFFFFKSTNSSITFAEITYFLWSVGN